MKPLLKSSRGKIQKVYGGWEVTRNGITSFYATIDEMPWRDRWLTKAVPFFVVAFVIGWIVLLPLMLRFDPRRYADATAGLFDTRGARAGAPSIAALDGAATRKV